LPGTAISSSPNQLSLNLPNRFDYFDKEGANKTELVQIAEGLIAERRQRFKASSKPQQDKVVIKSIPVYCKFQADCKFYNVKQECNDIHSDCT